MEQYGFVYLWYDKKHKRYYIGCRWGSENDGYICSSTWMKQGYKHRPGDFRRKILSKVYTNRKDLLEEECRWLSMIKEDELGKRYYNLHNHHFGHWSSDLYKKEKTIKKMIGNKNRLGDTKTPEERQKISKSLTGRKRSADSIEKQRRSLLGKKQTPESVAKRVAANKGKKRQGQALLNMQEAARKMRVVRQNNIALRG
jgi:hypothetical protein